MLDQAWDDNTGTSLDAQKVKEARQLEMEYYDECACSIKCLVFYVGRGQARRL